jgi:hypothetical protein
VKGDRFQFSHLLHWSFICKAISNQPRSDAGRKDTPAMAGFFDFADFFNSAIFNQTFDCEQKNVAIIADYCPWDRSLFCKKVYR